MVVKFFTSSMEFLKKFLGGGTSHLKKKFTAVQFSF